MENTKIILIRHGQSLGNATKTILGHTDMDLTDLGYKQAECTAKCLKNEKIDAIYSSDLVRAMNTAFPNAKYHNLSVIPNNNLREMYVGDWENMKIDDIIEKWGREVYENDWFANFGTFQFPNGESIKDGGYRFYNEIMKICKQNTGKTILISAHAAVIRAFWGIITGIKWEKLAETTPFPSNASYSIAYFDGVNLIPSEYSCDEHLTEVGITKVKLV